MRRKSLSAVKLNIFPSFSLLEEISQFPYLYSKALSFSETKFFNHHSEKHETLSLSIHVSEKNPQKKQVQSQADALLSPHALYKFNILAGQRTTFFLHILSRGKLILGFLLKYGSRFYISQFSLVFIVILSWHSSICLSPYKL